MKKASIILEEIKAMEGRGLPDSQILCYVVNLLKREADKEENPEDDVAPIVKRSGRYPWSNDDNQFQTAVGELVNLERIALLREKGLSESEIAETFGLSTSNLRRIAAHERLEQREANIERIMTLKEAGYTIAEMADMTGLNESSIVVILKIDHIPSEERMHKVRCLLENIVAEYGYVDIGAGTEIYFGVSRTKLNGAIAELVGEHQYKIHYLKIDYRTVKVLSAPNSEYAEVLAMFKGVTNE